MKGLLVDADARAIEAIEYQYGTMREWLPGGISIGHIFPNRDVLYVDDTGLLKPAEVAFRIKGRADGQPMMSNGLLTGRDNPHPDAKVGTLPPTFTIDQLAEHIEWLTLVEALDWFKAKADQPAVTRHVHGQEPEVIAYWRDILTNLMGGKGYSPEQVL